MANPADPQQLNRFSYVGNNSLQYVDPSGHALEGSATGDDPYSGTPRQTEINRDATSAPLSRDDFASDEEWMAYTAARLSARYLLGMSLSEEEKDLLLTLLSPGYAGAYNKYGIDTTPIYAERLTPDGPPAAIGWRWEFSGSWGPFAMDVNAEFLWRPKSKYGPGQCGVFFTPSFGKTAYPGPPNMSFGVGWTTGPTVVEAIQNMSEYPGPNATIGGGYKGPPLGPLGVEADVCSSDPSSSRAWYFGAGPGAEAGVYSYYGYTFAGPHIGW